MTATENEVKLILYTISDVRAEIESVRNDVASARGEIAAMDKRINGRIRRLEQFRWQLVGGAAVLSMSAGLLLRILTL